jgi:monoterpene epsilon-lactone hydrolase
MGAAYLIPVAPPRLSKGDTMTRKQRQDLDALLRHGPFDLGGDLIEQRELFHQMITAAPLPDDITATPGFLGGVPTVTVVTPGSDLSAVVLYFHGGAYVIGSAADSVGLASDVVRRAGARAVSVDYRLAPEHPYPAAVEDAVAAYRALLEDEGVPSASIVFVGESAGGGLVAATLVALKEAGLPQPAGGRAVLPWADLTVSGDSATGKAAVDPALTPEALRTRAIDYLGDRDPATPTGEPDLRGSDRPGAAADPGRLARDPARRRRPARRAGRGERRARRVAGVARASARLPGLRRRCSTRGRGPGRGRGLHPGRLGGAAGLTDKTGRPPIRTVRRAPGRAVA